MRLQFWCYVVLVFFGLWVGTAQATDDPITDCTCSIDFQVNDDEDATTAKKSCDLKLAAKPKGETLATALHCRTLALRQLKSYSAALKDINKAITADPKSYEYLVLRAEIYEALNDTKNAIADYRAALSINTYVIDASNALKRLGANKNDPGEEWKTDVMETADKRKISHPPSWTFQQWDAAHYLIQTDDQEPDLSCVVSVGDPLKDEHKRQDANHWSGVFTSEFLSKWCNDNEPGGDVSDTKLLKNQLVKSADKLALQCAWSLKRTAKETKKLTHEYIIRWFIPLDTVLLTMHCSAVAESRETLMNESPVFVEEFIRIKDSIAP